MSDDVAHLRDSSFDYDVLIVGAGQAGVPLAPKLAKRGLRVAVAERQHVGGSCVNFGCMPSKAFHACARVAHLARRGDDFGIGIDADAIRLKLADVLARCRVWTEKARGHINENLDKHATLLPAHARLARRQGDGFVVELDADGETRTVTARRVVLDPGAKTAMPDLPGLSETDPMTSETWIDRDVVGKRLLVLGGGYIGVEMAQTYHRLGHDVTVVQNGPQILSKEDADVAEGLQTLLEEEGVAFRLGAKATRVSGGEMLFAEGEPVGFDTIFVATGRRPNTGDLGLVNIGVETNDKGALMTDAYGEVDGCPGLYACGDCRGKAAFTHVAHDDHHVLLGHLLSQRDPGGSPNHDARLVPYAVFTDPEIGRVGLSLKQAREHGVEHLVIEAPMKANDRARVTGEGAGFVRLLIAPGEEGRLLGATILGTTGGELIHAFIVLMHTGRGLASILDAIFVHPTLFEVVHQCVDRWQSKTS